MKTVLVTGSTDGIGRATAMALAARGCAVIVHGRNDTKAGDVARDAAAATGNPNVTAVSADLESQRQVREMAERIERTHPRLDVLVNNAATTVRRRSLTEDGYESTFAINHLAPFLLTNLLLGLLHASAPARIVNVSSGVYIRGVIDLDDLHKERGFNGWDQYCNTKLANAVFTCELARRLDPGEVTANFIHPGGIDTKLLHVYYSGGSPVADGARTPVYASLADEVAGVTGAYLTDERREPVWSAASDPRLGSELWRVSEDLTGLVPLPLEHDRY